MSFGQATAAKYLVVTQSLEQTDEAYFLVIVQSFMVHVAVLSVTHTVEL
jgi:hypothetical protein